MPSDRRTFLATAGGLAGTVLSGNSQAAGSPGPAPAVADRPRFGLGIVTYNIAATWDLATLLRVCRASGVAAVEARTTHRHGIEPALSAQERRDVRRRFEDAGVVFWGCGSTCEFHDPAEAVVRRHIDTCRRFIDLTADLGGKGVKVRPNRLPAGEPEERVLERIGRALRTCGQAGAERNIDIWLEVHGPGTSDPSRVRTMMRQADHPNVGITWNSNPTDLREGSVAPAFRMLQPWIKSVHIHDLTDDYPYRELFRLLGGAGYAGYTLAEIPGMPDPTSGERLLRYYRALWSAMIGGTMR